MKKRRLDAPQLDWFCDVSGRAARVTSIGGHMLLVENHTGILEFTDSRIRLSTKCGQLSVEGSDLSLFEARSDMLAIRGHIQNVLLPDTEDARRES